MKLKLKTVADWLESSLGWTSEISGDGVVLSAQDSKGTTLLVLRLDAAPDRITFLVPSIAAAPPSTPLLQRSALLTVLLLRNYNSIFGAWGFDRSVGEAKFVLVQLLPRGDIDEHSFWSIFGGLRSTVVAVDRAMQRRFGRSSARASNEASLLLAMSQAAGTGDKDIEADAAFELGRMAIDENRLDEAVRLLARSRGLYDELDSRDGQAETTFELARVAQLHADRSKAERLYRQALASFEAGGNPYGAAKSLRLLGVLACESRELAQADDLLRNVLSRYSLLEDQLGIANVLGDQGTLARKKGDLQKAEDLYGDALARYQAMGETLGEATANAELGQLALARSDLREAVVRFEAARGTYEKLQRPAGVAMVTLDLGRVEARKGHLAEAEQFVREALAWYESVGARLGVANAVCELASIVGDGQRSDEAELLLLRALALYEATNDRLGAARATAELAELAASSGRQALAAHLFEDALDRFRSIGDDQGSANVLDSLGQLAFLAGSVEEAESQLQQARRLHVRIGDPLGIANTTRNLGRAAIHAGRRSDAEDLLLEASTLYTALGVDLGNANVARDLGLLAFQAIEADAARAYLSRAADLFERVGNTRDEVWALSRVAVVELYFCTDPISALEPARRAIARLERLRGSLRSLVTRSETGERWEEVYEIAIRALLAAGAVDPAQRPTFEREALATACLYQGRLLHEELVTARRLPAGDPWAYLEPDEAAQAAAVEARLDAAQAAYDELLDRTRRLLAEHGVSPQDIDRAARTEIATHPETAALLDAMSERRRLLERALLRASTDREPVLPVIELAAVEATLRAQGATLVDLVWGFGLHVGFVLGPQGTLAVHDFDADPGAVAAIEDARTRLATLLATDPPDPDPDAFAELTTVLAERLWRPLVGPLGVSPIRLVIAPAFGAVPFAALQRAIGGGPLRILPGPALLVREKAA